MNTFWRMVRIAGLEDDGYNLRNQGKKPGLRNEPAGGKTPERINIWDILSYASSRGQKKIDFSLFKQVGFRGVYWDLLF